MGKPSRPSPAATFPRTYDVSPDGERFLMVKEADDGETEPAQLILIQNWTDELSRLVPSGL